MYCACLEEKGTLKCKDNKANIRQVTVMSWSLLEHSAKYHHTITVLIKVLGY